MTYMIDKIARAMHAGVNGHVTPPPTWDNQSEQSQNYWRIGARAAITALREPTETMIDAGSKEQRNILSKPIEGIWSAMIDAALEDE